MNGLRYWYLKHFNPDKALEELRAPPSNEFVVVQDGPATWVRVPVEKLDEYMHHLKERGDTCLETYKKYTEGRGPQAEVRE